MDKETRIFIVSMVILSAMAGVLAGMAIVRYCPSSPDCLCTCSAK